MAKWVDPQPSSPPRSHSALYLYARCDCDDFAWKEFYQQEIDEFQVRLMKSKDVFVARRADLLIPPEMSEDRDDRFCIWRDELGILHAVTITKAKANRQHEVTITLEAGEETPWCCKHIIAVSRRLARLKWRARHVRVCWRRDPDVEKAIAWDQWQEDGPVVEGKFFQLTREIFAIAWGEEEAVGGSRLFDYEHEEEENEFNDT